MTALVSSTALASLRATLSGDRVVRESLRHALEITECSIAFLHAGVHETHLCIARHARDPQGRIRRATMAAPEDAFATQDARSNAPGFPLEVPRDLFDPTRIRSFAVSPLPPVDILRGALVCLDRDNRVFSQAQLHDLQALAFTLVGRLVPSPPVGLGERLQSLRRDLEPVTGLVRHSDRLAGCWRELSQTIDLVVEKLTGS